MFSKAVVKTDEFLDMPQSAQNLYFHLGIEADDDGFASPKMVMRMLGSNADDLKVLISKKFVIPFESGVIVIRHWKDNNFIRKDTYQATVHQQELAIALEDKVYNAERHVDDALTGRQLNKYNKVNKYNKKPFFNNCPVIEKFGKKYVIESGGEMLFTGKESDIEYK